MTIELLIHAIVRQTTLLIAQLATAHGVRAPLAKVANQVFLDLVAELERQGVSRKVSADMFGLGLRTYRRKIQRLTESSTERGRSLWEAVLEHVRSKGSVTRLEVLERFARDDEAQVRAVLHDLCESSLLVSNGTGSSATFRPVSDEEIESLRQQVGSEGADELFGGYARARDAHEAITGPRRSRVNDPIDCFIRASLFHSETRLSKLRPEANLRPALDKRRAL